MQSSFSAQEPELRRRLDALPSSREKAAEISKQLNQISAALGARREKLLALQEEFNSLTVSFWRDFARSLGCEDPAQMTTAARARLGFAGLLVVIGFISIYWQQGVKTPWSGIICAISVIVTGVTIGIIQLLLRFCRKLVL
jgi:hypothetical protein